MSDVLPINHSQKPDASQPRKDSMIAGKGGSNSNNKNELIDYMLTHKIVVCKPDQPFTWASGYIMPVYVDNRSLLRHHSTRNKVLELMLETYRINIAAHTGDPEVAESRATELETGNPEATESRATEQKTGNPETTESRATEQKTSEQKTANTTTAEQDITDQHQSPLIAATATAGIPIASLIAQKLNSEFVYVRPTAKSHGLKQNIEGLSPKEREQNTPLVGKQAVVIEDLVSTGMSVHKVAAALRLAGVRVKFCLTFFSYGFENMQNLMQNEAAIPPELQIKSCIYFRDVLQRGIETQYFSSNEQEQLERWIQQPFTWGQAGKSV